MNKTAISLLSLISIFFSIICSSLFADKSDDTLVIAFKREITNLDYHYGTKTEYLIPVSYTHLTLPTIYSV